MINGAKRLAKSGIKGLPEPIKRAIRYSAAMILRNLSNGGMRDTIAEAVNRNLGGAVVSARMKAGHRMLVDLRAQTEYLAYYTGEYDTHHVRAVLSVVKPPWIVLDVGANIGFWSVPLGKATSKVYAFEPVSGNYRRLRENIDINGLDHRVTIFPFGLSDQNASVPITLREDFRAGSSTGNAAIVPEGQDTELAREIVEIHPLDSLKLPLARLDFVKLDIEGHEPQFLRGAVRTIAQFRPILLTEINNWYYEQRGLNPIAEFEDWMAGAGYVCAIEDGKVWRIAPLRERKKRTSDVFLLPEEHAAEWVERINQGR
jgi:FkbM family methyltransferase